MITLPSFGVARKDARAALVSAGGAGCARGRAGRARAHARAPHRAIGSESGIDLSTRRRKVLSEVKEYILCTHEHRTHNSCSACLSSARTLGDRDCRKSPTRHARSTLFATHKYHNHDHTHNFETRPETFRTLLLHDRFITGCCCAIPMMYTMAGVRHCALRLAGGAPMALTLAHQMDVTGAFDSNSTSARVVVVGGAALLTTLTFAALTDEAGFATGSFVGVAITMSEAPSSPSM